jgi:hypothetical protein
MNTKSLDHRMTPLQHVMKYFGFLMAALYVVMGVVVVWRSDEIFNIPDKYAIPLGSLLVLYGLFRLYRLYQKYF